VKPYGAPATAPGDHRFWPNPAEFPETLERLRHDARPGCACWTNLPEGSHFVA
jgi:hypothetical protein